MTSFYLFSLIFFSTALFCSCGEEEVYYYGHPADSLIENMEDEDNFVIILEDMDYDEEKLIGFHKYKVIKTRKSKVTKKDTLLVFITKMLLVADDVFDLYIDDLGMEIATKQSRVEYPQYQTSPAGFSQHIGNKRYGDWKINEYENDSLGLISDTIWQFSNEYSVLKTEFQTEKYKVYPSHHDAYFFLLAMGINYYGYSSKGSTYGSAGKQYAETRKASKWNNRSSDFKKRTTESVVTRNSSRYDGSSNRSRGGGFGK